MVENRRFSKSTILSLLVGMSLLAAMPVLAQSGGGFDLTWSTIDGGGETFSTGGGFSLGGTVGQTDADTMSLSGGGFQLDGGFWTAAVPLCGCLSDVNDDGLRNGDDIQDFVDCVFSPAPDCVCADLDGNGQLEVADVGLFVSDLLTGANCP